MSTIKPVFPGDPPVAPGPTATPAEHRWFAEDNAYHSLLKKRWEDWILNHPDDAEITATHSFGVLPGNVVGGLGFGPAPHDPNPITSPPPNPTPRPDATSPRQPKQTGATGL